MPPTSRVPCFASSHRNDRRVTQRGCQRTFREAHVARRMSPLATSLIATLWVSIIALGGIVFLFTRRPGARGEAFLLSFAAGVLLATAFLDLLPEAVERSHDGGNIF